jgi:hypothetical protein
MDLDFQWMWWMCMWGHGNGSARSWQSKLQKPWGLPSVLTSVITSDDTTPYHRSHGYRRRARAADQPYRRVQRPAQHTGTSIYVYLRLSTSIYVYLRLSTSIYVYLRLSTSIYVYAYNAYATPTLRLRPPRAPPQSFAYHLQSTASCSIRPRFRSSILTTVGHVQHPQPDRLALRRRRWHTRPRIVPWLHLLPRRLVSRLRAFICAQGGGAACEILLQAARRHVAG